MNNEYSGLKGMGRGEAYRIMNAGLTELAAKALSRPSLAFIGVDWAKDSGMNKGDIYKKVDNVCYVRFADVKATLNYK